MRFLIEIEDTIQGIRATAFMEPNHISNTFADSLAALVVAGWTEQLRASEESGFIKVEHVDD